VSVSNSKGKRGSALTQSTQSLSKSNDVEVQGDKYILVDFDHTITTPRDDQFSSGHCWINKAAYKIAKSKENPRILRAAAAFAAPIIYFRTLQKPDKNPKPFETRVIGSIMKGVAKESTLIDCSELKPNEKFIKQLKVASNRGYKIAIVTSTPAYVIENWMDSLPKDLKFQYETVYGLDINSYTDNGNVRLSSPNYRHRYTHICGTIGSKAAKSAMAAKLISMGHDVYCSIGNAEDDLVSKELVGKFLLEFGMNSEEAKDAITNLNIVNLYAPMKGKSRTRVNGNADGEISGLRLDFPEVVPYSSP